MFYNIFLVIDKKVTPRLHIPGDQKWSFTIILTVFRKSGNIVWVYQKLLEKGKKLNNMYFVIFVIQFLA